VSRVHRVLVGGTGSGKKQLAAALCRRHGLRPLSMDSMKVYRGMDIGTDKPPAELVAALDWGLLDLVGHDESFSAGRWLSQAEVAVERGDRPVLFAGGTPLYLRLLLSGLCPTPPGEPQLRSTLEARWEREGEGALREELAASDPVLAARLLPGDKKRIVRALEVLLLTGQPLGRWQQEHTRPTIAGRFVVVGLRHARELHVERLRQRVERMFAAGLVAEVEALRRRAPFAPEPARAIGYAEALAVLDGRMGRAEAERQVVQRSRRLVRKQGTFLRSFAELRWIDVAPAAEPEALLADLERALELG